jgi:tRNA(fMet)-specific endonuclease VapC
VSGDLVDTDWLIDVTYGQEVATRTLADLSNDGLAVSVISYGELDEGAYHAHDRAQAIAGVQEVLRGKMLLPITPRIMETFGITRGQLPRQLRQQVGDLDLLIAATALTHDVTLLTRNLRDFQHVPGLKLYGSAESAAP